MESNYYQWWFEFVQSEIDETCMITLYVLYCNQDVVKIVDIQYKSGANT